MTCVLLEEKFQYDGVGPNCCPICEAHMSWHLPPTNAYHLTFMACEECEIVCNVETERVFKLQRDEADDLGGDWDPREQPYPSRA